MISAEIDWELTKYLLRKEILPLVSCKLLAEVLHMSERNAEKLLSPAYKNNIRAEYLLFFSKLANKPLEELVVYQGEHIEDDIKNFRAQNKKKLNSIEEVEEYIGKSVKTFGELNAFAKFLTYLPLVERAHLKRFLEGAKWNWGTNDEYIEELLEWLISTVPKDDDASLFIKKYTEICVKRTSGYESACEWEMSEEGDRLMRAYTQSLEKFLQ